MYLSPYELKLLAQLLGLHIDVMHATGSNCNTKDLTALRRRLDDEAERVAARQRVGSACIRSYID